MISFQQCTFCSAFRGASNRVRCCAYAVLLCVTFAFVGCTATYRAGHSDAVGNYRVYGHLRGAYGRAYLDQTDKVIRIGIVETIGGREKSLLVRKYRVYGSDVCWRGEWDWDNNLTVVFFDYGPGILRSHARQSGMEERLISKLNYHFDSKTGKFTEQTRKQ